MTDKGLKKEKVDYIDYNWGMYGRVLNVLSPTDASKWHLSWILSFDLLVSA